MDLLLDIVLDAAGDTLGLVPFLLATYLVLEALEHTAGERVNAAIRRAGAAGPVVGALLGMVPQCGFSAMGATLYAGRVITLGTLVAVFLSTSDEMLPLLVAGRVAPVQMAKILAVKVVVAMAAGLAADAGLRALRRQPEAHAALRQLLRGAAEAGEGAGHIHELCEREHCGCDEEEPGVHDDASREVRDGGTSAAAGHQSRVHAHPSHVHGARVDAGHIFKSACKHTLQVTAFIFLVTLALVAVLDTVGEAALAQALSGNSVLAILAAALVGLIPNCAASVVLTELYLEGVLAFAPAMAGLLVSAGTGFLVLFRTSDHPRENLAIAVLLYTVSVLAGFVLLVLGM